MGGTTRRPPLPPQMYSVGRLTRICETHRARIYAYMRVYTCIRLWRVPTATGITCVLLYQPLTPYDCTPISLAAATLALPLPRAVIQSSASYDLYVVIPSVWSSERFGFSLRALPFVSIRPACTRAYMCANNCEQYARFVSVIADRWLVKPLTEWFDRYVAWRSMKKVCTYTCNVQKWPWYLLADATMKLLPGQIVIVLREIIKFHFYLRYNVDG